MRVELAAGHFRRSTPKRQDRSDESLPGFDFKVTGGPDPRYISTSHLERQNLTRRMGMGRLSRLTNGFSKKIGKHAYQVALYIMHSNFTRIHKTLWVSPAMVCFRQLTGQSLESRL
jgi:hypothetical protein